MGPLVVLVRHPWLTLSQLPDKEKMLMLDVPLSLQGLFGLVMEQMQERFETTKNSDDALKTFLPWPPPPGASL